jgi:hypothetical protein
MMVSGKRKSLMDLLLSDPDKFQAQLKAHDNAVTARTKAGEEYNQRRADAIKTMQDLAEKQLAFDIREKQIETSEKQLMEWEQQLSRKEAELHRQERLLEGIRQQADLHKEAVNQSCRQREMEVAHKAEQVRQRDQASEAKAVDIDKRYAALVSRETLVSEREKFILDVAHKLKS